MRAATVVIVLDGAMARLADHPRPHVWLVRESSVNSGTLKTRVQGIGCFFAQYSASFLISGRSAAVIWWHPMQRATEGRPAYSERRASAWQYWQSIL